MTGKASSMYKDHFGSIILIRSRRGWVRGWAKLCIYVLAWKYDRHFKRQQSNVN